VQNISGQYGTKIAPTAADWDLINVPLEEAPEGRSKPAKDVVLAEGQPFNSAISPSRRSKFRATPGSLAFIFPVKDKGQTRTAGLFGGTVLTTGILTTDALKQYTQSITHYLDAAKKMNVDVELQNHPIFDGMPDKLAKLKSAKASDPNPFVIGNDRYSRCGISSPNAFRRNRAARRLELMAGWIEILRDLDTF
jgi:metallo-beta-lactamase class B